MINFGTGPFARTVPLAIAIVRFTLPSQNLFPVSADMNNSTLGTAVLAAPVSTTFFGMSTVTTASGSV